MKTTNPRTKDQFSKQTISIHLLSRNMRTIEPFEALAIGNYAVHRTITVNGPTGPAWSVTHVPTGVGASASVIDRKSVV